MAVCRSGLPDERLARRPRILPATGEFHSPTEYASWARTRGAELETAWSSAWPSVSAWPARNSGSATRMACSLTPGCRSAKPSWMCSGMICFSPSSVQSACKRVVGRWLFFSSLAKCGAAEALPRSTSSRCAVSRCQPLGLSRAATSSGTFLLARLGMGRGVLFAG